MPTKQVIITGTMTWAEEPGDSRPPQIWGPTDPRPGYGLPGNQPGIDNSLPQPPPGIWGPTDPRPGVGPIIPGVPPGIWGGGNVPMPTPPIHLGPGGGTGIWGPNDPRPGYGLPGGQGGTVSPPAAGVPIKGSLVWVERFGYVFIPESASGGSETPPPPDGETPEEPEPKGGLFNR